MLGKIVIALVSARHRHYRTSAIGSQNVVADPDRDLLAGKRMQSIGAGKGARNVFDIGLAVSFGFERSLLLIRLNLFSLAWRTNLCDIRMFRRQNHEAHAKNGIWARSKYFYLKIGVLHYKLHTRALRLTDPVALLFFECVSPVDAV